MENFKKLLERKITEITELIELKRKNSNYYDIPDHVQQKAIEKLHRDRSYYARLLQGTEIRFFLPNRDVLIEHQDKRTRGTVHKIMRTQNQIRVKVGDSLTNINVNKINDIIL